VSSLDFASRCLLEALRRSTVCLQLRHRFSLLQHKRAQWARVGGTRNPGSLEGR
jgi:hypothetical protein